MKVHELKTILDGFDPDADVEIQEPCRSKACLHHRYAEA